MLLGLLFLSSSCTTGLNATKEFNIKGPHGSPVKMSDSLTIHHIEFETELLARQYAMERRLLVLRKFETMIEPYFGTVNAKNCRENLKSDILISSEGQFVAVIKLLSYGPERLLHDCLEANNTDRVMIEFLVCDKNFYDIRNYYPLAQENPPYRQNYFCKENK